MRLYAVCGVNKFMKNHYPSITEPLNFKYNMKMKNFILIILISFAVIISLRFVVSYMERPKPLPITSPVSSAVNIKDIDKSNPAYAYFKAFKNFDEEHGITTDKKYLVLDLNYVYSYEVHGEAPNLTALFLDYCDKNGLILLLDTLEGLREKRYITKQYPRFDNGVIVYFLDNYIDYDNELSFVINIIGPNSPTHGSAYYIVKLINGEWEISENKHFFED